MPLQAEPLPNYRIARDDCALTVFPPDERVTKFLTLKYREMRDDPANPGRRKIMRLSEPMYKIINIGTRPAAQTYQGFWRSLKQHLEKAGSKVWVMNTCLHFPAPNLHQATIGLRKPQIPWILSALLLNCSGLIGAPTRYGKTYGMMAICRAYSGCRTVIVAPGVDLCEQIFDDFKKGLPPDRAKKLRLICTGSRWKTQGPDITICSVDSLDKCDVNGTELMIIDEPHAMAAHKRFGQIKRFHRTRKFGFGATLEGRFDKKDRLIEGLIGPVLINVSYKQAVADGSIAPLKVVMIKIPFSKDSVPGLKVQRDTVYKRLLFQSAKVARLLEDVCARVIPEKWQTMVFIKDEKQADYLMQESMKEGSAVAMAKKLKPKARKALTKLIADNGISRILASKIYVQGVTFPDLRVVINLEGGGANTTAIQKPGRLLQVRPGKNYGVMVDFILECTDAHLETRGNPPYGGIIAECWARHKAYQKIGYDIIMDDNGDKLAEVLAGSYHPDYH